MIARWAASLLLAAVSATAVGEPRQPTGKWIADFAETQCIAYRNYGTEEKPLYLVFRNPPLGSIMQVSVMRKGGWARTDQLDASVSFDRQPPIRTNLLVYKSSKAKLQNYLVNLPLSQFQAVRTAQSIRVRSSGGLDETFALATVPGLLKIMDECVADLRTYWNISDTNHFTVPGQPPPPNPRLRQRAMGSLQGVFRAEDYPAMAISAGHHGSTRFVILIDEQGRVADCTVIETSGVAALDAQSCAIIEERARFQPAIGLDGKPARDAHIQRVSWRME